MNLEKIGKPGMLTLRKNRRTQEKALEHAARSRFQQIFTADMAGLHLLALLLTADPVQAEDCFVAGLEESVSGNTIFRRWARSWSKRAIIRNAIKALQPAPGKPGWGAGGSWATAPNRNAAADRRKAKDLIAAVIRMEDFERFVFVLCVLEGHSGRECAALLSCPLEEVLRARLMGLEHLKLRPASATTARGHAAAPWPQRSRRGPARFRGHLRSSAR